MSSTEEECLLQKDVLCFSETWLYKDTFSCPQFLKEYDFHQSSATKTHSKGRASGGLMVFTKRKAVSSVEIVVTNKNWIFLLLKVCNKCLIVGLIYLKPGSEGDMLLNPLFADLSEILAQYEGYSIILGGDFNARVGLLNNLDLEEDLFDCCSLHNVRNSCDVEVSGRGSSLVNLMELNGFVLCNGRSKSDFSGNFTYISNRGCSVIDTVWINYAAFDFVNDFEIEDISALSDHCCCSIKISVGLNKTNNVSRVDKSKSVLVYVRRDFEGFLNFYSSLEQSENIYFSSQEIDDLFNNFYFSVLNALTESKLIFNRKDYSFPNNKPWYTNKCFKAKQELNKLNKKCKLLNSEFEVRKEYVSCRNKYRSLIKQCKFEYYQNLKISLYNVKKSSEFWSVIKRFKCKKSFN